MFGFKKRPRFKTFPVDRALSLLREYAKILFGDYTSTCIPERNRNANTLMTMRKHLQWMVQEMHTMTEKPDKFYRWLGFVQGAMWVLDLRTIDEMRVDNYILINGKHPEK